MRIPEEMVEEEKEMQFLEKEINIEEIDGEEVKWREHNEFSGNYH